MKVFWTAILLLIFYVIAAHAQPAPKATLAQEDMGMCNPLRFSTARTGATLATAIASTGSASRPDCSDTQFLLIPAGEPWIISSNLTVPVRMKLYVPAGATLQLNAGVTLQADGCWEAGNYKIFQGTGIVRSTYSCGIYNPTHWGVDNTFTNVTSSHIQLAIDAAAAANGGIVQLQAGKYKVDTLHMASNVALEGFGRGNTELNFIAHSGTHNPVIRIGDSGSAPYPGRGSVLNAVIRNLKIDGNRSLHPDENISGGYSPCIIIWGSHSNTIENTELKSCAGDGVTIGYEIGRLQGADRNTVQHNIMYDHLRHAVAITWGNENELLYNKVTGSFDLERDPGVTSFIKKNIVRGNTGRDGDVDASLFVISLGSQHETESGYFGNIVTDNVMAEFFGQFNTGTIVSNNVLVGTSTVQTALMRLWGFYDATICNNVFKANQSVATALTTVIDVRAGANLRICDNIVDNGTLPFSTFTGPFFGENYGYGHIYNNNIIVGSGPYHGGTPGSPERIGETAILRVTVSGGNPNIVGLFQMSGVPLWGPVACNGPIATGFDCGRISFRQSGPNFAIILPSGGVFWQIEALTHGNFGAQTEPFLHTVVMQVDENPVAFGPSARTVAPFMAAMNVGNPNFTLLDFSNGSGTPGVFFVRITY